MAAIHMAGLSSGMDIQGIVDKLLQVETVRISSLENKKIALQADVSAWTAISGKMGALTDSVDVLRDMKTWDKMKVASSDTAKLTGTATSSALPANYRLTISDLAQAHSVASDNAGTLSALPTPATASTDLVSRGVLVSGNTFTIEGQTITIGATESLNTLAAKINTAADSMAAGSEVTASILDNRLVITRDNTGSTEITMADASGTPLTALGLFKVANELVAAQDASFTVNGATVTRSSNSGLTDVITGVTLNLLQETGAGETLTLAVTHDTDTIKSAIEDFISSYNSAVSLTQGYISIDLTDPKKPVTGELQGDTLVSNILSSLRKLVTASKAPYLSASNASYTYDGRTGVMDSLEDIGIWTSGKENSISMVDEDKLDNMLANNFDKMEQLFRGVSGVDGYEHGVAEDLYDYLYNMSTSLTGTISRHTDTIETEMSRYQDKIDRMYSDLDLYEQRLWTQFGAMDDAMTNMQAESAYIASFLK